MDVVSKKRIYGLMETEPAAQEKKWDNPIEPDKAVDERDVEQIKRQKQEAERRKENLTDTDNKPSDKQKN